MRAEGPHHRRRQSKCTCIPTTWQIGRPTAAAWKPAGWHGPWAGTVHGWLRDLSPAGPAGDRFSGYEVFFQPICGRFNWEAVLAWSSGCVCTEKGHCRPRQVAEAKPAAVLCLGGCWLALQSPPWGLCNGSPAPPSLPTVGAAWSQPLSSEQQI